MEKVRRVGVVAGAVVMAAGVVVGPARAATASASGVGQASTATTIGATAKVATGTRSSAGTEASAAGARTAARPQGAAGTVRYAWLGSCVKGKYDVPCGPWKLVMRSGKTVAVRDATVFPVGANGKADKEAAAPFTVSADGARILYFRKSDRKLVWRAATGGRAHSLPGATARVPKGIGMGDVDATLSPDGGVVVLDYLDDNERLPTLVVDLADGHVARVPGSDAVHGFSPDGRRLLVSRQTSDNTTEFAVYDADGAQAESREVPQVVSNNAPVALADDGVTVAVVIVPSEGRPRLRQYDLSTDAVSPAVDLPITAQDAPYQIFWNDAGKLTLWHMRTKSDGTVSRVTASVVDPATGGLRKIDSFKGPSRVWNWWLPGE